MTRAAIVFLAGSLLGASGDAAEPPRQIIDRPGNGPVRVQLDSMPLGALATMLMRDVMRVPYVISPDVLNDARPVSVNLVMARRDLPVKIVHFLRSVGLVVELKGGTVYVSKRDFASGGSSAVPSLAASLGASGSLVSGNPLSPDLAPRGSYIPQPQFGRSAQIEGAGGGQIVSAEPNPPGSRVELVEDIPLPLVAVVRPAHRSPSELAGILSSVVPTVTVALRDKVAASDNGILGTLEPETLVFSGAAPDLRRALDVVKALDVPRPSVSVRAVVFEVRNERSRASALSLLASALSGKIEVGSLPSAPVGDQFIRIATGGLSAVLSAVKGDGRFKIIAEPSVTALSGSSATINSGAQVPTIGSVTYAESGEPVRSIVYRDSGVSLTVKPTVRLGEIQLDVSQERSSFGRTTTGVDDTPTLNKSSSSAQVALAPGETIALASLDERSETFSRQGLFGGLLGAKSSGKADSQLLVLIQADLMARSSAPATAEITVLGAAESDEDAEVTQEAPAA